MFDVDVPRRVRIKHVNVANASEKGQKILRIVLDADGEEYEFAMDLWDALDLNKVREILLHWKNTVIPKKRQARKMTDTDIATFIESLKGLEV